MICLVCFEYRLSKKAQPLVLLKSLCYNVNKPNEKGVDTMDQTIKGDHQKGEIEILYPHIVFENQYIKIFNDDVIFPGGYRGTYVRVSNPSPKSVAVLPVTPDCKILLIKTFRHGARGWAYEIPKGGVESGEDAPSAALRELWEETGYSAEKLIDLGEYYESPAIFSGSLKCYLALNCRQISPICHEKTEAIEHVAEIDINDVLRGHYRLDFGDAMTELLVYKYCYIYRAGEKNE